MGIFFITVCFGVLLGIGIGFLLGAFVMSSTCLELTNTEKNSED